MISYLRKVEPYTDMVWGIGGGLTISLINLLYFDDFSRGEIRLVYEQIFAQKALDTVTFLAIVIVFAPIVEELIFRVYIFKKLRDKFDIFWGYLGSTILFAFAHILMGKSGFLYYSMHSIIITYIYQKTDSFRAIFTSHSLWNLNWVLCIYFYN